ncbi:MAG: hypothetical protein QXW97_03180 [Candidatus Pacearchaeota archaeon]
MDENIIIENILKKVKEGKKYKDISDDIILKEIKIYLNKNPKILKQKKFKKKNIQEIRRVLHRISASYQTKNKSKQYLYLELLKKNRNNKKIIKKILESQKSTQERIKFYKDIYTKLFSITGIPSSIIDLGCGMNPVSYPFMKLKKLIYYAYDIDESIVSFLNKFFEIERTEGLIGKSEILDIRDLNKIKSLPNSDLIFLFKLIDLIDTKKRKISEPLIKILINKSKFVIASFATKTLTGKNMNLPKRRGFELMLQRNHLNFNIIQFENEIFYIIFKSDK